MATQGAPPPQTAGSHSSQSSNSIIHEAVRPLEWMVGRWRGCGEGKYPSIDDFDYAEDISFTSVGQPCLNYQALSRTPDGSRPMHLESGFLKVATKNPQATQCAFLLAHNFGLTTNEEGYWDPATQELTLELQALTRMSFAKDEKVKSTKRVYKKLNDDEMEFTFYLAAGSQSLQEHLKIHYRKVCP